MYLIHVSLGPSDARFPPKLGRILAGFAAPADGVEHVSDHSDHLEGPVVGLYLTSPSLAEAEAAAERVCRRALAGHPALSGVTLLNRGAALCPGIWWEMG